MKNILKRVLIALILVAPLSFISCTKDDVIPLLPTDTTQREDPKVVEETKGVECQNLPLLSALKRRGFRILGNRLVINERVRSLKKLDLSDESLHSIADLDKFPALEELNLSNNYLREMDFSKLAESVKSIELQGNPIGQFLHLDPKRKFEKLYLPKNAYFDLNAILAYYKVNKDNQNLDMKCEYQGKMIEYNFLREVPTPEVHSYMKKNFPSIFVGDKIDLSKKLSIEEQVRNFVFGTPWKQHRIDRPDVSLDGIQFVIGRQEYKGRISIFSSYMAEVSYLNVSANVPSIYIRDIRIPDAGYFDISGAISAYEIYLYGIDWKRWRCLDLSKNIALGKPNNAKESKLFLNNDDDIREIKMPKRWAIMNEVKLCIRLSYVHKVRKIDLSQVTSLGDNLNMLGVLELYSDKTELLYPKKLNKRVKPYELAILPNVDNMTPWKEFYAKNKDLIRVNVEKNEAGGLPRKYSFSMGWDKYE